MLEVYLLQSIGKLRDNPEHKARGVVLRRLASRWAYQRNYLSPVPPIDAEIAFIDREHGKLLVQFAHPDQTQIRKIGLPVGILVCQFANLFEISGQVKGDLQKAFLYEAKHPLNRSYLETGLT